jgi:hypothetical protein
LERFHRREKTHSATKCTEPDSEKALKLTFMTLGNKSNFAIESGITRAYRRLSFLALGFFVIYLKNHRYGVCEPDATMLACSVGEIEKRLDQRGSHIAPFATEPDAGRIVDAFLRRDIELDVENQQFFGLTQTEVRELFYLNKLVWAPDGDEAFDDSSYVLQFDVNDHVRLIGFTRTDYTAYDPASLNDVWLSANDYYGILKAWHDAFDAEWKTAPKVDSNEA